MVKRAVFLLLAATCFAAPAGAAEASPKKGEKVFQQHCARCHGMAAEGQDSASPYGGWLENGSRIAPALNGSAHSWNHSPKELFRFVQKGSMYANSSMRPFEKILSGDEILSAILFFQSLWPEEIMAEYRAKYLEKSP